MKHRERRGLALCALALALSLSAPALAAPAAEFPVTEKQMQTLGIRLLPLTATTNTGQASYPAKVTLPASSEFVVSAPVGGLVSQVLIEPGQRVAKGHALLRLDSPDLARMQLDLLQTANQARLAEQTAHREESLFKEGIIPERRWQEADTARRNAAAALSQARAALAASGVAAAAMDRVIRTAIPENSLTLAARAAGTITTVTARPGLQVEPAAPLLTLVATDTLWLEVTLPAQQATWIKPGDRVTVSGRDVAARVINVSPLVGGGQSLVLRAKVESGAPQLRPGELVQANLPLPGSAGVWDLPLAAVARQGEDAYVFVRTATGFLARPVKVIASAAQQVRVQGALKAGDQVAVSSVVTLKAAWMGESGGD